MPRIYVYKMVADNNGAPCIYRRKLSLAICKPAIRRTAGVGDYILGFMGKSKNSSEPLVYVAKVTTKSTGGDYFKNNSDHVKRPDCIYLFDSKSNSYSYKSGAKYHSPSDLEHDLGEAPGYKNSNVLLSDNFFYLGRDSDDKYKTNYPVIKNLVGNLGRGHRVKYDEKLLQELEELIDSFLSIPKSERNHGLPTHGDRSLACYTRNDKDDMEVIACNR